MQWGWYVHRHQGVVPVLYGHLLTASATLRHEIYEMLEMEAITGEAEREEAVLALSALEHADYLSLTPEEKRRIQTLKAGLATST